MKRNKNIKEGYKKTKIGTIPKEWKKVKLGDVANVKSSKRVLQKDWLDNGVPFYRTREIIRLANNTEFNSPIFISEKLFLELSNQYGVPKAGDLLVTGVGTIGKTYIVKETDRFYFKDGNVLWIEISDKINPHFLHHSFKARYIRKQLVDNASITTVATYTITGAKDTYILLPSIGEQQAIAHCLTTWDKGIETLSALIAAKREQKKGLMQGLFSGELKVENGELVKVEDEKLWLKGWKEVRLGEITKRITRKNKELDDTVVTISAQRGFVLQEDYFKKRVASSTLSNYYLLHKGEFAYNKSYSKGYPMGAFKRLDDFDKAVVTTLYICFKLKENVDSDFLLDFFEAGLMINNLMRIAQEGGRAHGLLNIGLADFFNLKLRIPDINEQRAIAEVLTTADKEIELLEKKLEAFKTQKKGLMQVLLTGTKRLV